MIPLLSIIIPLYNKQECILKTLDSVLSQDYCDFEIVIIDDGSTDDSVSVVESIEDKRLHIFKKENGGPSSARNYGVKKSRGEWVLFLDADDILEMGALKQVVSDIRKHKYADVLCYNLFLKEDGEKWLYIRSHKKGYLFVPFLDWYQQRIYPRTGNMVCRRSVLLEEPYREDYKRWEDGENTFRLMRKYRFYAVPIPLFTYCRDSIDASKPRENVKEDFCCNLQPKGKSIFEKIALYKLYQEACGLYPEQVEQLYGDTFRKPSIIKAISLINLSERIKKKSRSLLRSVKHFVKQLYQLRLT